jgi:hypothetical protein
MRYPFIFISANVWTPRDTFIYEYIGEVVSHPSFVKRMRDYAEEGIQHFYFMMLQKDEVCLLLSCTVFKAHHPAVHRCNKKGRGRPFRESQLQPELLRGEMDGREEGQDGDIFETENQEG